MQNANTLDDYERIWRKVFSSWWESGSTSTIWRPSACLQYRIYQNILQTIYKGSYFWNISYFWISSWFLRFLSNFFWGNFFLHYRIWEHSPNNIQRIQFWEYILLTHGADIGRINIDFSIFVFSDDKIVDNAFVFSAPFYFNCPIGHVILKTWHVCPKVWILGNIAAPHSHLSNESMDSVVMTKNK